MPEPINTTHLRELLGAATKGPWKVQQNIQCVISDAALDDYGNVIFQFPNAALEDSTKKAQSNADAIVAVINAAPALLAELDALRGKAATYDELKENLPADWPCQHPETGVSVLDDVHDLIADRDALRARVAELEARAKWRPISKAHEDFGEIILARIDGSGDSDMCLSHVCSPTWDEDAEGMTHFAQVPELTIEEAARLREGGE